MQTHAMVAHLLLATVLGAVADGDSGKEGKVPLFYSTDLHLPCRDPDDHFDLATLFALPEFDIRGIILDCGEKQVAQPGLASMRQMMHLTGRTVPHAIGLRDRLRSPTDDGCNQPAEFQKGVELLLDALRWSRQKVTIITVGSLRDVAAALNRQPELLRRKVERLYINVGNAASHGRLEGNVRRCLESYVALMRSGLPVYWCPCQDGDWYQNDRGYSTHWAFCHYEVLESAPLALQNYFLYALADARTDPIPFLAQRQDISLRRSLWKLQRNMWSTVSLLDAARRRIVQVAPDHWAAVPNPIAGQQEIKPYGFLAVRVAIDDQGVSTMGFGPTAVGNAMHVFRVFDQAVYGRVMTSCLRELFARMPVKSPDAKD